MNFLIDEDVPVKIMRELTAFGHNVTRVPTKSSDINNAKLAQSQNRILITLDKDFANTLLFPPTKFNIILIDIHPPYKNIILDALTKLLKTLPSKEFKGLIILMEDNFVRITG